MTEDPLEKRKENAHYVRHVRLLRITHGLSDNFRSFPIRSCKKRREKNGKSITELVSSQLSSASYLGIISVNAKPPSWIFFSFVNERNSGRELPLPRPVHFRHFLLAWSLAELRDDCFLRRAFELYIILELVRTGIRYDCKRFEFYNIVYHSRSRFIWIWSLRFV